MNNSSAPPQDRESSVASQLAQALAAMRAIAHTNTWQELVEAIAAHRLSGVDSISLLRFRSAHTADLMVRAQWDCAGRTTEHAVDASFSGAQPIALDQLDTPLIYDQRAADQSEYRSGWHVMMQQQGFRYGVAFPLLQSSQTLGYLSLACRNQRAFTAAEIQSVQAVAHLCATMIITFERNSELSDQIQRIQGLYRISEVLIDIADEQQLLDAVAVLLVNEVGYVNSWFALVDHAAGLLCEKSGAGAGTEDIVLDVVYSLQDMSITGVAAVNQKQPIIVADAVEQAIAEGWGDFAIRANLKNVMYVPLRANTSVIGVLSVGTSAIQVTEAEIALLVAFGNQIAMAITRARLQAEQQRHLSTIEQSHAKQAQLLEAVRSLSTPIIPIYDGILILPLVGTIDESRGSLIIHTMLAAIQRDRASVVILDVTGVANVDLDVMEYLIQAVRAAALLGTKTVLVGVHPEIAQTLVQLGGDFSDLTTRRDLASGMTYALRVCGRHVALLESRAR